MGREIVYCWKCAKRLDGSDFDDLKAYRYGDKVSCDECVYDLVGDLPAEEQEAILSGQPKKTPRPPSESKQRRTGPIPKAGAGSGATTRATTVRSGQTGRTPTARGTGRVPAVEGSKTRKVTRSIPKVEEPASEEAVEGGEDAAAKKKKLLLIGAGGGGLLLVAVVVLIFLLTGKSKPKAAPAGGTPEVVVEKTEKPATKKLTPEEEAERAFENAMSVFRDKKDDLGAQMKALREAEAVAKGTKVDKAVQEQIEALQMEVRKQLRALDSEIAPLYSEQKYKDALALLSAAATKYDFPEWKTGVETKVKQTNAALEENFGRMLKGALEAKEGGETAKVDEIAAKVAALGMPEFVERLKKELAGAAAPAPDASANPDASKTPAPAAKRPKREPKPLSKDMQAYIPAWERAAALVFQRDFDGAATEIRKSLKEIDAEEVRKEANADIELFEKAKAWVADASKLQTKTTRLESLTLEVRDKPGEFKTVTGKVAKVFDQRFELRGTADKDGKKVTTSFFVEYADLSGKSLAERVKKLRSPAKDDGKLAALLCLLEGDEEAASAFGGKDADELPDRYWVYAPTAKERAPKGDSKEFTARDLFHKAEVEYKSMETRAASLDKYKTLLNEFSTTRIVRDNNATIIKRGEVPKETVFNARSFKTEGSFRPTKKPDLVLQGTKDVDIQEMRENFVEAEFYAQAGVTYRCWAYVGGCCKETLAFYLQTSERTTTHQGKQLAIDPGANMAEAVKHQISGLKADHAAHAPKDKKAPHPKDATRWEWVPIPLAKTYANAGAKSVRLMTDQAGFAVKFIVVSSLRTKTPDDKETAELVKALNEDPGSDDSGVKGTPEPKDWLLAGPFNEPLNQRQAPENEIDLAKEMTGKSNKKFKWRKIEAAAQGGAASFNFEANKLVDPKDNVSAYLLIHVKAPSPMTVQLAVGHDDGCKIWVNDESVHFVDKGAKPEELKPKAVLEDGWNRILVKVRNGNGGYAFSMKILDEAGQPVQGLEFSAYGDQLVPP